ncbi:CAP domain-containing protein, partial [Candidatus Roizmanbacteria bacterium]|nr:CAP domain-containing protein [Candidatus Roizmanbacteria bacterium]
INKLYQLTNQQREKNGLSDLSYNKKLSSAAQKKAQDMFNRNYWAHYGPDGVTPWDFILKSDYQYEFAGENLAKNFLFSQGVVDAWMNSVTHRENILRKDYSEIGFAVVNGVLNGEQTTLVVQMFGKPIGSSPLEKNSPPPEKPQIVEISPAPKAQPAVLAKHANSPSFRLGNIPFNMNVIFLVFLMLALVLDFYFASKLNIIRIGGKNIAHFIFLGFVFVGLLLLTKGAIL